MIVATGMKIARMPPTQLLPWLNSIKPHIHMILRQNLELSIPPVLRGPRQREDNHYVPARSKERTWEADGT